MRKLARAAICLMLLSAAAGAIWGRSTTKPSTTLPSPRDSYFWNSVTGKTAWELPKSEFTNGELPAILA
jgi:hypothetical protein